MSETIDSQGLLESIHKIAQHIGDNAPPKRVSQQEYMARRAKRNKLTRKLYMSGARVPERSLTDEEIGLLNKLRAGKFNGGRWAVLERNTGGPEGSLDIILPNATREDQMRLMGEAPNLTTLLEKMLAEQDPPKAAPVTRAPSGRQTPTID